MTNTPFSKKRALLHALAILAAFVATTGLAAVLLGLNTGAAGDLAGTLAWPVLILGFLASYLHQRGRRLPAAAITVLLCGTLPVFFLYAARRTRVTEVEKAQLDVSADPIRHPYFRFVLPHPGSHFRLADVPPQMAEAVAAHREGTRTILWMLQSQDSSEAIMISVYKGRPRDDRDLARFAAPIRARLATAENTQLLQDTLVWDSRIHEVRLKVRATDVYLSLRCLASVAPPPALICVFIRTTRPDGLDFVQDGLAFEPVAPQGRR